MLEQIELSCRNVRPSVPDVDQHFFQALQQTTATTASTTSSTAIILTDTRNKYMYVFGTEEGVSVFDAEGVVFVIDAERGVSVFRAEGVVFVIDAEGGVSMFGTEGVVSSVLFCGRTTWMGSPMD